MPTQPRTAKAAPIALFLLLPFLAPACTSAQLSRAHAEKLILGHPDFFQKVTTVTLGANAGPLGTALGLWYSKRTEPLAPLGANLLSEQGSGYSRTLSLNDPLPVKVTVTGIAPFALGDGERIKIVEFTFRIDPPFPLNAVLLTEGTGSAQARLFDDGWRIENVSHRWSPEAAPFSPALLTRIQSEAASVLEDRRMTLQSLSALVADRRTVTTTRTILNGPIDWQKRGPAQRVELTDVSIHVIHFERRYSSSGPIDLHYYFEYFDEIKSPLPGYPTNLIEIRATGLPRDLVAHGSALYLHAADPAAADGLRDAIRRAYDLWRAKYRAALDEISLLTTAIEHSATSF